MSANVVDDISTSITCKTTWRTELKQWLLKNSKNPTVQVINDDTDIIEERIITSVQTFDIILLIEKLRGAPVDLSLTKPRTFHTIDGIGAAFFPEGD